MEAGLYRTLDNGKAQCRLCSHFCLIEDGGLGRCGVRENRGGVLRTLAYDAAAAVNIDPVEKKPLYHFQPGTTTFSLGTMGCNLACTFCQNWSLSQSPKRGSRPTGQRVAPEGLVDAARRNDCASLSYTYSEPTVFFELVRDTSALAREQGLGNIMVSNGFMSPDCLDALAGTIDAANIDLKAFTESFYKERCDAGLKPVLDNLKRIRALGWWLEVTSLLIPGLNDSDGELRDMAGFIAKELGAGTPWHLSRFHPTFELTDRPPTPVETLEKAHDIGKEAGLRFVYVGNVPGNRYNSTYCPACGAKVLDRTGFRTRTAALANGACGVCGERLEGVWQGAALRTGLKSRT